MQKFFYITASIALSLISALAGWWIGKGSISESFEITNQIEKIIEKPLEKYSIINLSQAPTPKTTFEITQTQETNDNFTSSLFSLSFDPTMQNKSQKLTTGLINIPNNLDKEYPVVIMLRGYVDPSIYQTGVGTYKAAQVFAENGYITIAPDFLGYAGSDSQAGDIFESRFQTYTTALAIINSLGQIPHWDNTNIFIWAHSNGGQIALTTLEITQLPIPTTLWAPVTKPFPYSVLYYTDESADLGKYIRKALANFETLYDVNTFSLHNYIDRITAPIQLHQGTADDAIPVEWSDNFTAQLKAQDKDIQYYIYPGADHNLQPSWNTVVARDLQFFSKHIKSLDSSSLN